MAVKQNSCNLLSSTPYVVNSTGGSGTYTTIQAAMTAASVAGGTVLVTPGIYVENLAFYGNVNLTAISLGAVTIVGNQSFTNIGTITISNIVFTAVIGSVIQFGAATVSTTVEGIFNNCTIIGSSSYAPIIGGVGSNGSVVMYLNNSVVEYTSSSAVTWTNGTLNYSNTLFNGSGAACFVMGALGQLNLYYCSVFPGNYPAITLSSNTAFCGSFYNTYFNGTAAIFHFTGSGTVETFYDNMNCSNASGYWADQSSSSGSIKYGYCSLQNTAKYIDPALTAIIQVSTPMQGGMSWLAVTANTQMYPNFGYIVTANAPTLTMPTKAIIGDHIQVILRGGTSFTIAQNASQQCYIGSLFTTSGTGGSIASSSLGDCISLVCAVTTTTWQAESTMGNLLLS